jgi:tRNA dimethylallyltransferase
MSKLIIITGATATGKSDLAVAVAKELQAEIISADSMQLYKGMDIGTAKLTLEERNQIPHHLLDVVNVKEDVSVSWYQEVARTKIDELRNQGKNVVVVGGMNMKFHGMQVRPSAAVSNISCSRRFLNNQRRLQIPCLGEFLALETM